jgi:hypothetical protein
MSVKHEFNITFKAVQFHKTNSKGIRLLCLFRLKLERRLVSLRFLGPRVKYMHVNIVRKTLSYIIMDILRVPLTRAHYTLVVSSLSINNMRVLKYEMYESFPNERGTLVFSYLT